MFGYGGSDTEVELLTDIKQLLEQILQELKKEK
jgi:hypothetical protein